MARDFSGTGQYLTGGGLGILANESIWFSARVWVDSLAASCYIADLGFSGTGNNRRFLSLNTTGTVEARSITNAGTAGTATTVATLAINGWYSVVGEWANSASRAASLDGGTRVVDTNSRFITGDPTQLRIAAGSTATALLNGRIAYAAYWRGAPTDSERSALADGLHPLCIQPSNLVDCWDFVGAGSPEPGRVGNTLTLTGSPTEIEGPRTIFPRGRSMVALAGYTGGGPGGGGSGGAGGWWFGL